MPDFKLLYKRDTTGKICQWQIEVDGGKYRTISGDVGGKLVTSAWTVCEGKNVGKKNETTPAKQALKEAQSEHRKKTEKGYVEDINEVDNVEFESPMLAKSYDDYGADLVYPVYCQPKLDGIRCVISAEGMRTRNNKPIVSCPHIHSAVKAILDKNPGLKLDGELYSHDLKENFNRICELVKKQKPTEEDLEESKAIEYWCYDIIAEDLPFGERSEWIHTCLNKIPGVVVVDTFVCNDQGDLDEMYEQYLAEGYEGQIIRTNTKYQNKRTKDLLKRKEFQDGEWLIGEILEGVGGRAGTAGKATLLTLDGEPVLGEDEQPVKSNFEGNFEWLRKLWADREQLKGKKVTIRHFKFTPSGAPRFPYITAIRDYE